MREAVMRVKSELGTDAVILHTRRFREKGLLGLGGTPKVEVLAGVEENKGFPRIEKELQELRGLITQLNQQVGGEENLEFLPSVLKGSIKNLFKAGVTEHVIRDLVEDLNVPGEMSNWEEGQLVGKIRNRLLGGMPPVVPLKPGSHKPQVVAFIGPSGVGKTSTLAKLAANFTIARKENVGIITTDTHRMGAVEQLKNYSEVLGVSLEVVLTSSQMESAVERFQDKNLILIDTAGVNVRNAQEIERLEEILIHEYIDEILLVLSVNIRGEDLLSYQERYRELRYTGFIFTKLDETEAWGPILNLTWGKREYLSYVTQGQNVPEDIELIDPQRFVTFLMGEST